MGVILLVFIVGVVAIIGNSWAQTEKHNQEFEAMEQAFKEEKESVLAQLAEIDANGGSFEDRAAVKISITDETFYDWIAALDASYNKTPDSEGYAEFKGATIELEGLFYTKKFENGPTQYWVFRYHNHGDATHEHVEGDLETSCEMIPIEVIYLDKDAQIPADGSWVSVTGVVGPDSTKNLSAVRNAVVTVEEESGSTHIH